MGFTPLQATPATQRQGFTPITAAEPEEQPGGIFHPAVETVQDIGRVYPVVEAAGNLATQAVAIPVAGLAGLGAAATKALGLTEAEPADVVHQVSGALTYQPQTEAGQHFTHVVTTPFEMLQAAGQAAGGKVLDATGSPAAATAVDTAVQSLPMALGVKGKGRAGETVRSEVRSPVRTETGEHGFTPLEDAPEVTRPAAHQEARQADVSTPSLVDAMTEDHGLSAVTVSPEAWELVRNGITTDGGQPSAILQAGDVLHRAGAIRDAEGFARVADDIQAVQDLGLPEEARQVAIKGVVKKYLKEAKNAQAEEAAPQRVVGMGSHVEALSRSEGQGFQELRGAGDQGLPAVDQQLLAIPAGRGAETGQVAVDLAGQAGREQGVRAGELPVGEAPKADQQTPLLPSGAAERSGGNYPGNGAEYRDTAHDDAQALAGHGAQPREIGNRGASALPQGFTPLHPERADAEPTGMGAFAGRESSDTTGALAARDTAGTGADTWPAVKVAGRTVTEYSDAALERLSKSKLISDDARAKVNNEMARRAAVSDGGFNVTKRMVSTEVANGVAKEIMPESVDDSPASSGAETQAMADGVQNGTWNPGANYSPFVDQVRAPTSTAKTVADLPAPKRREQVIKDFSKSVGTSVYEGRVKGKHRLGFFRPRNEEVRIKRANDLEVTAHEVAHLIDYRVPEIKKSWEADKVLRDELKSVSYDQKNVREGFAEAMRLFLTQPEALESRAPGVHAWLERFANTHEYGPALKKAQADMTAWFGQDALNRARSKIGTDKPLAEFFDGFWDRFRQATVDDLHGIYRMERDLTGKTNPVGPYESARLSRASASIADGAIRYGYPFKKPDGSFTFKGKGLEEILKPVAESLDDALLYFVGRSARELQAQGREHLFTLAETDAMLRLRTPEREQAFQDYQAWNKGILDFAGAQGVVNKQARAMWQRTQYLPFHRVGQAGGAKGAKPGDWSGIKALTGGTENIKDVLGNMVQNAAQLIDKAVKNEARVKIADLADKAKGGRFMVKIPAESRPVKIDPVSAADAILKAMGINRAEWNARGQKLPRFAQKIVEELEKSPNFMELMVGNQPPAGSNVVAVLRNGKPDWYEVGDPILYRALSSIDRKYQHWLINWLGLPKRIGQATITMTPEFWMANVARDTIMGSIMSQHGFKPVLDSLRGIRHRMMADPVYKDYIANGGGLSSIYLDETKLRAKMEKFYTRQGIDYRTVLDAPDKLLGFVETLGDSFEMSTRLGEFQKAVDAGENPRHAAYQGRDVSTDFAMRGDSQALGMMYDIVLFMKPAVLSWDRLYRGLAHDPNKGAIAAKAGALALASAGLYLLNRDDPRYQDLPDWDRDANWHFFIGDQHFRYPKIWEIGALSSAAERTVERTLEENPEGLGKDFARILGTTFNLNLMPQIVAPLYEQATNRNSFTGSPIETPGMENTQPFLRSKPGTSETMKALGMATGDMPESMQVNPARAEALVRGYFNTWAMYGLMLSDQAFFGDKLAAKRTDELPVVRRFYANDPAKHTRYESEFYDLLEESKRLRGTLKELDDMGRKDWADRKEQQPLAGEAKPLERAAKNLSGINKDMEAVRRDAGLASAEKRQRLDGLTVERNALLKDAVLESRKAQQKEVAR